MEKSENEGYRSPECVFVRDSGAWWRLCLIAVQRTSLNDSLLYNMSGT